MNQIKAVQIEVATLAYPGASQTSVFVLDDKGRVWMKESQVQLGQETIGPWERMVLPEEPSKLAPSVQQWKAGE